MNKKILLPVIVTVFLLVAAAEINADSSSLFRFGGTVQPIDNNNVRMAEEKVDIEVYGGWSKVRCEFIFKNDSGDAQNVLMGFPASMFGAEGEVPEIDETTRLRNFKAYDEGLEKRAKLEKSSSKNAQPGGIAEWYTWDVHFEAGQERKIINTYKIQNYSAPWERRTGYILETGAPWKETIGKAVITFELMDISPSNMYEEYTEPKGYKVDKNKVIWEMKNFEPKENVILAMPGYWSIYEMLYGQNEEYINNIGIKIEQARTHFIDGNEEESFRQARSLLDEGVYGEDLYLCLLNYYRRRGNIDGFIKILKEEIAHLNNPNIMEWAEIFYPDRLEAEGISYPKDHKVEINNQTIKKLNDKEFQLSADFHDEAGDMIFFSSNVYTDPLTMDSILDDNEINIFGYKNFNYRVKGKLPEPYRDLIWRLEINDYYGNTEVGMALRPERIGESCYFYDGDVFTSWILKNDKLFTLCYYDRGFDTNEQDFRKALAARLGSLVFKLGIRVPEGGFTINLYDKSVIDKLQADSPQNITLYLKDSEYRAKLHNDNAMGKSREESLTEWDWGEIISGIDPDNLDKMADEITIKILADKFGPEWMNVKPEISRAFIASVSKEPGKGGLYKKFADMSNFELREIAREIGTTGRWGSASEFKTGWIMFAVTFVIIGGVVFAVYSKKTRRDA